MRNQIQNYRVEYFGGPQDGEIEYTRIKPSEVAAISTKYINNAGDYEVEEHHYVLNWINTAQAKYIYHKVVDGNG